MNLEAFKKINLLLEELRQVSEREMAIKNEIHELVREHADKDDYTGWLPPVV